MNLAESTFKKVMEKLNPDDYDHEQFKNYNQVLYKGIMETISECGKGPKELIDKLKAQIATEDTEYLAMVKYAKSLEQTNRELVDKLKSIKRYYIDCGETGEYIKMTEEPDGDYVMYDDLYEILSKHSSSSPAAAPQKGGEDER